MKTKTLIELLSLSSSICMIARDKEFLEQVGKLTEKGKRKIQEAVQEFNAGEDGEDRLIEKVIRKAKETREELEHKIEETSASVYRKMHIAHTDELKEVLQRIEVMERRLSLVEGHLLNFNWRAKDSGKNI